MTVEGWYLDGLRDGRSEGHQLAREIIAKHGTDRYPGVDSNMMKLVEEIGELMSEILAYGEFMDGEPPHASLRKEYGDVGLTLYALGNKLGLNLFDEMQAVVEGETRSFT